MSFSMKPVAVRVTYRGPVDRLLVAADEPSLFFQAWQATRGAAEAGEMTLEVQAVEGLGAFLGFLSYDAVVTAEGRGATTAEAVMDALSGRSIPQDAAWEALSFEAPDGAGAGDGKVEAAPAAVPPGGNRAGATLPKGGLGDVFAAMERAGLIPVDMSQEDDGGAVRFTIRREVGR